MKYVCILLILFGTARAGLAQANGDTTVFTLLQAGRKITIRQEQAIEKAVCASIERNSYHKTKGYRVRLYFDNEQRARQRSLAVATAFVAEHPDVAVYHSFEDLYFRVAVGDFRTRSEAMRFLESIKGAYPSAFIIACPVNLMQPERDSERVMELTLDD
ncbi:MAG: SPOR domain-containing protein [Prevotellaceae bacterium]|nr:SPOR domain-containing protein [Prevotellaceae bacterium]